MWHLKTKLGTFWLVPTSEFGKDYYLGINEDQLGLYHDAEQAAKDVHDQTTGFFPWDSQSRVIAPEHIYEWQLGEPQDWVKK